MGDASGDPFGGPFGGPPADSVSDPFGGEFARGLARLLGPAGAPPVADVRAAAAAAAEWRAARRAAEPHEWALVRHAWPADARAACVDTLHRLARNLGGRPAWLVVPGRAPAAAALDAEAVLDNPLGFAALSGASWPELRLLDRDVAAGLRLARRSPQDGDGWVLEVWGEPWLSAATRALRGVG